MRGLSGPKTIGIPEAILLKRDFPNLNWDTFDKCWSDPTVEYNCIAFAVGDTSQRWWPGADGAYWPDTVPQEETLEAFIAAYGTKGYVLCDTGAPEKGFEKIALFADSVTRQPKHAAHQLPDGRWESKLGAGIDIEHDLLEELIGPTYGGVARFLKRPIGAVSNEAYKESYGTGKLSQ